MPYLRLSVRSVVCCVLGLLHHEGLWREARRAVAADGTLSYSQNLSAQRRF